MSNCMCRACRPSNDDTKEDLGQFHQYQNILLSDSDSSIRSEQRPKAELSYDHELLRQLKLSMQNLTTMTTLILMKMDKIDKDQAYIRCELRKVVEAQAGESQVTNMMNVDVRENKKVCTEGQTNTDKSEVATPVSPCIQKPKELPSMHPTQLHTQATVIASAAGKVLQNLSIDENQQFAENFAKIFAKQLALAMTQEMKDNDITVVNKKLQNQSNNTNVQSLDLPVSRGGKPNQNVPIVHNEVSSDFKKLKPQWPHVVRNDMKVAGRAANVGTITQIDFTIPTPRDICSKLMQSEQAKLNAAKDADVACLDRSNLLNDSISDAIDRNRSNVQTAHLPNHKPLLLRNVPTESVSLPEGKPALKPLHCAWNPRRILESSASQANTTDKQTVTKADVNSTLMQSQCGNYASGNSVASSKTNIEEMLITGGKRSIEYPSKDDNFGHAARNWKFSDSYLAKSLTGDVAQATTDGGSFGQRNNYVDEFLNLAGDVHKSKPKLQIASPDDKGKQISKDSRQTYLEASSQTIESGEVLDDAQDLQDQSQQGSQLQPVPVKIEQEKVYRLLKDKINGSNESIELIGSISSEFEFF